jgi:polar amino acid transport system substrate-binding protein
MRPTLIDRRTAILGALFGAAGCATLPRDPEGTLRRVQGGKIRVGLVESAPWAVRKAGEPAGAEVALVGQLAAELGAATEWVWGGEQQHMEALEHFALDLVIGGLTDDTAWEKRVGLTSPYLKDRILVGFADAPPTTLSGVRVSVKRGDPAAAKLKREGATPVPVPELTRDVAPLAAADWHLEQLGLDPADVELQKRKHVMAVPPGENGWLRRVEEFLQARGSEVRERLKREVAGA